MQQDIINTMQYFRYFDNDLAEAVTMTGQMLIQKTAEIILNPIKHIAYENGSIRNADGKLIAFFDKEENHLYVDGYPLGFRAENMEHAMEIVGKMS